MYDQNKFMWFSLLARAAFHSRAVMAQLDKVTPENIRIYGSSYVQAAFFGILQRHWQQYQDMPSVDIFHVEAEALWSSLSTMFPANYQDHQAEVVSLYQSVVAPMVDFDPKPYFDFINEIYRETVAKGVIAQAAAEAQQSGDFDSLARQATELSTQLASGRSIRNPLSKKEARPAHIIQTGIDWFDMILGGGLRVGNSYGILAPTGGGKTTISAQISTSLALQGFRPALIYTEQSFDESELIDKFWALVTGKKADQFAPYDDESDFPEDLVGPQERIIAETITKNVQGVDFSQRPGSIAELRSICAGGLGGPKPNVLIVDWAGQFARQLLENNPPNGVDDETKALRYIADELALISRESTIPVIFMHQLRPDCTNPTSRYDHTDANMCKQMFFNVSYGVVINPRDQNDITTIRTTKGRWSARGEQIVELRGPYSRFDAANGWRMGKRKYVNEQKEGKMPGEPKTASQKQADAVTRWMHD